MTLFLPDPKNLMVRREAIMEREKRRRTNIKVETSNDASRSIKDNVSSDQLREKKKLTKSADDDDDDNKHGENDENKDEIDDEKGSEENSSKLSNLNDVYKDADNSMILSN